MKFPVRALAPALVLSAVFTAVSGPAFAQTLPIPTDPSTSAVLSQLGPEMRNVVQLFDAIRGTRLEQLTPQDARQQFSTQDAAKILARGTGKGESATPVGRVVDGMTVPGRDGNAIPVRIYYPAGAGPFPVVVYFHGGGFVVATIDTYDESARNLSVDANAIVVSVEYRKAPEAPFPAAYNDALDSYRWVTQNIANYGGLATKVAVAGESAGGNLATEVAIAGRDGLVQKPVHQLLIYPITSSNLNQPSDQQFTSTALPLYTALLPFFNAQYVQNPSFANDPRVAPINANLTGLAPATIVAAEFDPLANDGAAYYKSLLVAKVPVQYKLYPGVTHEFFGLGAVVPRARAAEQFAAAQLVAAFKGQ